MESIKDHINLEDKKEPVVITREEKIKRQESQAKIIITSTIHYRDKEGQVRSQIIRSSRIIKSQDDLLQRKLIIGKEWIKLECAWITEVGYISFRNDGLTRTEILITKEKEDRIIEIGYKTTKTVIGVEKAKTQHESKIATIEEEMIEPYWLIHSGECHNGTPVVGKEIYLRCREGETTLSIFILPN